MIQYIIIPLSYDAISFCHYSPLKKTDFISKETLCEAIKFSMKHDLAIHYIYPNRNIPRELNGLVDSYIHTKIMSSSHPCANEADVIVVEDSKEFEKSLVYYQEKTINIRCSLNELNKISALISKSNTTYKRLNIILTDLIGKKEDDFDLYARILNEMAEYIVKQYKTGKSPQINTLTDRLFLSEMNNCDAGVKSITAAPNGNLYLCPAFINCKDVVPVGNIHTDINIPNQQLLKLDHCPICRICDSYHCHRCIWMNYNSTEEVNTPSHEQCVFSHLERNASKKIIERIHAEGITIKELQKIDEINHLDPFEIVKNL